MIQRELKSREDLIDYARKRGHEKGLKKDLEGVFLNVYINSFAEGFIKGYQKTVRRGIKKGYSNEIIADITRATIEEVRKIRQQLENNK